MVGRPPGTTSTPGVYRGGTYGQLNTQTVTSVPSGPAASPPVVPRQRLGGTVYGGQTGLPTSANADAPVEMSGSLTGLILSRGRSQVQRKKQRRARLRTALFVTIGAIVFIGGIALVVALLAGDFIRSLYNTLVG